MSDYNIKTYTNLTDMDDFVFTPTNSRDDIAGIITFRHYQCVLTFTLLNYSVPTSHPQKKKVLVDLLLHLGTKSRFLEYDVSKNGILDLSSGKFTTPDDDLIHLADDLVMQYAPDRELATFEISLSKALI